MGIDCFEVNCFYFDSVGYFGICFKIGIYVVGRNMRCRIDKEFQFFYECIVLIKVYYSIGQVFWEIIIKNVLIFGDCYFYLLFEGEIVVYDQVWRGFINV